MIKVTIEIDDEPPVTIISDSKENVTVTGFMMEPNDGTASMITHDPITISGSHATVTTE